MLEYEGRELNIKKVISYCFSKWYILIVFFVIGGCLLGGIKYRKDINSYNANYVSKGNDDVELEKKVDLARSALSDEEKSNVNSAVAYYNQIAYYNNYMEKSIFVNLNPDSVERTIYLYNIELDDIEQYNEAQVQLLTADIVNMYMSYLDSGVLVDEISGDFEIEEEYIGELVVDERIQGSSCFRIIITASDMFENIDDSVLTLLSKYEKEVNSKTHKHSLKLLDSYTFETGLNDIIEKREEIQSNIYNAKTRLDNIKKNLTDNQLLCYEYDTNQLDEEVTNVEYAKPKINILFVFCGGIFAIFIYFIYVVLKLAFSPYAISETDFSSMLNLKYLGSVTDGAEHDNKINASYTNNLKYLSVKLKNFCENSKIDKLVIISSNYADIYDNVLKDLQSNMNGIAELVLAKNILNDSDSLSILLEGKACIFAESIGRSRIKKMKELIYFCKDNDIDVLGVIDIRF